MRAALDRPYPAAVAARLREVRHDVVALAERPDVARLPDDEIAAVLWAEGRALVAQNVGDWLPLARRLPALILIDRDRYPRTPLSVERLILSLDALLGSLAGREPFAGEVHWLEPPPGCPFWPAIDVSGDSVRVRGPRA